MKWENLRTILLLIHLIPFNNNNNIIIYNNNGDNEGENVPTRSIVRNNIIRVLCVSIVRMEGV